jgi:hypothetical protein
LRCLQPNPGRTHPPSLGPAKGDRREKNVRRHRLPLNGNLHVGVWKDSLIVQLGPDEGEEALREPQVREFAITGRAMKGLGAG